MFGIHSSSYAGQLLSVPCNLPLLWISQDRSVRLPSLFITSACVVDTTITLKTNASAYRAFLLTQTPFLWIPDSQRLHIYSGIPQNYYGFWFNAFTHSLSRPSKNLLRPSKKLLRPSKKLLRPRKKIIVTTPKNYCYLPKKMLRPSKKLLRLSKNFLINKNLSFIEYVILDLIHRQFSVY